MRRFTLVPLLLFFLLACSEPQAQTEPTAYDREVFRQDLRNAFLDDGMDVKVNSKGENNDTLELEFILFSDVWVRKYETGTLFEAMKTKGFKTVILSDGHRYKHIQYLE